MKKKLLAIDQGDYLGGAERFLSEILTRISDEYEVHLICGKNTNYHQFYKDSDVELHITDLPRLRPLGWATFKALKAKQKELLVTIKDIAPDLMISNTVRSHIISSALAGKLGIDLIWMAHDLTFPKLAFKWLRRYPKKIICCSDYVKSKYEKNYRAKSVPLFTLYPFGIDEEKVEELKKVDKKKIIGMIGNFIPWKGQDTFIRCAKSISEQHPDYQFELIGRTYRGNKKSEKYYQYCQKLISDLGLTEKLKILQSVPDVFENLSKWKVLVHCSNLNEPLGRVILEGMAAGCAVIASDMGGPKEVIENNRTGIISKPVLDKLTENIEKILDNNIFATEISKSAQFEISENYNWDTVIDNFTRII